LFCIRVNSCLFQNSVKIGPESVRRAASIKSKLFLISFLLNIILINVSEIYFPVLLLSGRATELRHVYMIMPGSTNYLIYTFITWQRCACADGGSRTADRRSEMGADHWQRSLQTLVYGLRKLVASLRSPSSKHLADVARCLWQIKSENWPGTRNNLAIKVQHRVRPKKRKSQSGPAVAEQTINWGCHKK